VSAEHVQTRDGTPLVIRPIRPEDREALLEGFERLSPESRYRRFFSPMSQLSAPQLDYLTRIDHHDHEALLAFHEPTGRLVGVARYVRTGPGVAEPAMVVADDFQGHGVATLLLGRLVDRARGEGIGCFVAAVLAGNPEAVHVLGALGDAAVAHDGTTLEVTVDLDEPAPAAAPPARLRGLLRGMAAGTLEPALTFWHRLLPRDRGAADAPDRANLIVAVPAEGSESPALALSQALAERSRAQVVVVGARVPLMDDPEAEEHRLARACGRLRGRGIEARTEVRPGDLAAVTLDVAIETRARLIVVDGGEAPDASGRLLGSTWDHVSHHAPCDVLVARG
jgi:RimJ/RimL family protein N-acetyltransferase/nucleotide-binding universal stress UspA family protein